MDPIKAKKIDEIFQLWLDRPGAGGQLVIHHKGEVYERCYGYQNIEAGVPMSQESVFQLASMSKQVTAMCIFVLYERGMLGLEDDVTKYLPDLVKVPRSITIRNLLHHTSGLPDHSNFRFCVGVTGKDTIMQAETLRLIAQTKELNFEPGTDYGYSNPNYLLLATIVERLTGQTLNEFCQENIFKPLGMTKTFVRDDPDTIIPNRVHSYNDDGYHYTNAILNICAYGSASLQSTARDMSIYLRQYINPTLISRETMEKLYLYIPPLPDGKKSIYASGVFIEEMLGHKYIHHGGVQAGFRNFGVCFPEDDLIIVRLSNTYNLPFESTSLDVARIMLDLPPRERKTLDAYKTDTVNLDIVPGFYYCDKNGESFQIQVRDGVVYNGDVELKPIGGNLFKQGWMNITFAFGENTVRQAHDAIYSLRKVDDKITVEQAVAYTGKYICEDFESCWEVIWQNGKLYLYHLRHGMLELHRLGGDVFCNERGVATYTFLRDAQGKVVSFNRSTDRQKKMIFTKCR